jgi:hypothetical protein
MSSGERLTATMNEGGLIMWSDENELPKMKRFTVDANKLTVTLDYLWASGYSSGKCVAALDADCSNAVKHQSWLNTATVREIVDWVEGMLVNEE